MVSRRIATDAYARIVHLYLAGELSARPFALVFMAMWGVVDPPSSGRASVTLHDLFALLEALDIDAPIDEDSVRASVEALVAEWIDWRG